MEDATLDRQPMQIYSKSTLLQTKTQKDTEKCPEIKEKDKKEAARVSCFFYLGKSLFFQQHLIHLAATHKFIGFKERIVVFVVYLDEVAHIPQITCYIHLELFLQFRQ